MPTKIFGVSFGQHSHRHVSKFHLQNVYCDICQWNTMKEKNLSRHLLLPRELLFLCARFYIKILPNHFVIFSYFSISISIPGSDFGNKMRKFLRVCENNKFFFSKLNEFWTRKNIEILLVLYFSISIFSKMLF